MDFISEDSAEEYYSKIRNAFAMRKTVFLFNPRWSKLQRTEAIGCAEKILEEKQDADAQFAKIFIASGGSGGKIRFVSHTWETLASSAFGLIEFLKKEFSLRAINLCCFSCLPPWHVSGLMPLVRATVSGGRFFISKSNSFREEDSLPQFRTAPEEFWMNSLVPTQLHRILARKDGAEWLRKFNFVLLGGAGVPAELLARAKAEGIALGVGYGMTETASLVAMGTAPNFLAGTVLPHAKISVGECGRIRISAKSLSPDCGDIFDTNDEGFLDAAGKLHVTGRLDRFINSGGEKIDPLIVETEILKTGFVSGVLVVGEPDPEWGSRLTALLTGISPQNIEPLKKALAGKLPRFMLPKRFIRANALPFDEKGKLDRVALSAILA